MARFCSTCGRAVEVAVVGHRPSSIEEVKTVFGLGKVKISVNDLSERLASVALHPLENPSEDDLMLRNQAVQVGVDPKQFTFEVIAINNFTITQAINRERLEGRMTPEIAEALIVQVLKVTHRRLHENTSYDLLLLGLGPEEAFELMMQRGDRYSQPAWGKGSMTDIRLFFAEFCGFPNSDVLKRIGWILFQFRGDEIGEFLRRKVKVI